MSFSSARALFCDSDGFVLILDELFWPVEAPLNQLQHPSERSPAAAGGFLLLAQCVSTLSLFSKEPSLFLAGNV